MVSEKSARRKTRIAHVITKLELGGAQQNTLWTLNHLDKERYRGYLFSGRGGILDDEVSSTAEYETRFVPSLMRQISPFHDLIALAHIWILCVLIRPDIIHTHSSKAGIIGRWAAFFAGVPVIIHTYHGFGFNDFQPFLIKFILQFTEYLTAPITTTIVVVSSENIQKGLLSCIGKRGQYVVIHSGIKVSDFAAVQEDKIENARREIGIKKGIPVIGMIGCFKPQKAPLDFIYLAKKVSDKRPDVQFVLIGDGLLRPQIESEIERLNLKDKIILTGWRRDISSCIALFDILVLTSLWEGLPRVFPEAMAAGKPIVATWVDGAREAVLHGINGYLVAPHDVDKMSGYVLRLLDNPDERRRFGAYGKRRVYPAYDIDEMVRQLDELYQRCV